MSEKLENARRFEADNIPKIAMNMRPAYHLTGSMGWINDPNGFSLYKGELHLFYQANQYEKKAGSIHWGHVKTKDLIHWERVPVALAPDMPYDRDGCFSGGAVETPDGKHLIMYTGFVEEKEAGIVRQTQCIAVGDGMDYEKHADNPVLAEDGLPEGGSIADFRDPKIWREADRYMAAVVNRDRENRAVVLIYESPDGLEWKYKGTAAESDRPNGRMWECPDFFAMDGEDCFLYSVQGMDGDVPEEDRAFETILRTGVFDRESCRFRTEEVFTVDYGTDFYAPQTVELPDGRRIMTAWMQSWRTANDAPDELDFRGQMIFPRELSLADGVLVQHPARELNAYRRNYTAIKGHDGAGRFSHEDMNGRCAELDLVIRRRGTAKPGRFMIHIAEDFLHRTVIEADLAEGMITVDLTDSGNPESMSVRKSFPAEMENGAVRLKILLDRYSMELFAGGGKAAASFVLYAPQEADGISFEQTGGVSADIDFYRLEI